MTNDELLDYIYSQIGGEAKTTMSKPVIIALATLALKDLAKMLIMTNSELAKKLVVSLANQAWTASSFSAPSNMLFDKQKETTRLSIGTELAYQVEDRDKLDMSTGLGNIYYALEGKTFYIKHSNVSTTSGNNLNITYYKIPSLADIDAELRNDFIQLVMARIIPKAEAVE